MSIYNTSRNVKTGKGKEPATPRTRGAAGGPIRPGMNRQRMLQQQFEENLRKKKQEEEAKGTRTFEDYPIWSTSKRGQKHHLMDFKTSKPIDFNQFTRPVKLNREHTNFLPLNEYVDKRKKEEAVIAAAQAEAAAKAAAIMAGTPIPEQKATPKKQGSNVEDLGAGPSPDGPQVTPQPQHGPKTGADVSLIAPLGGATRNKLMMFKKKTKQVYAPKEDSREIKQQEQRPWILEDYDAQNSFTGTYEGGQTQRYMFLTLVDNAFKLTPMDRWYNFRAKRNVQKLTPEEVEEKFKQQQKKETGRWMMLNREASSSPAEGAAPGAAGASSGGRPSKLKLVDHDDAVKAASDDEGKARADSDMDDLDFDDVFQDDDEAAPDHEVEDEDMKEGKERVKKEIKDFAINGFTEEDDDLFDANESLTSEGKQMRKLVRDIEKNRAYESDEDIDPYASSDQMETDDENDATEEEENKEKKLNVATKKKTAMPPKKKPNASSPISKSSVKPTSPIGRPVSPMKSRPHSPPPPRASSPMKSSPTSPSRPSASSPSSSSQPSRKRPDESSSSDKSNRKGKLITEEDIINRLRGKSYKTMDLLTSFRDDMKNNPANRTILATLVKKVAKKSASGTLELKDKYNKLKHA